MIVPNQIWNCAIIINLLNQSSKINALEMDDNPQMNLTTTETETNYDSVSPEQENNGSCEQFSLPKSMNKAQTTLVKWYFICKYHTNISISMDQTIKDIPQLDGNSMMHLIITETIFPNLMISSGWYGEGEAHYFYLEFRECEFNSISEAAFDQRAFRSLNGLAFSENPYSIELKAGILTGLNLMNLEILNTPIKLIDYDFLLPIRNRLSALVIRGSLSDKECFIHIIGGVGLPFIRKVNMQHSMAVKIIRVRYLYGIQNVTTIEMSHCGLEAIEEHTFDHLSKTLTFLNLDDNNFATLPNTIFDELLKSKSIASVFMERNPWLCDCDLCILVNKIESSEGFHMSVYSNFPVDCELFLQNKDNECSNIPNTTSYQPSISCLTLYGTNFLSITHPKYNIWTSEPDVDLLIKAKDSNGPLKYYTLQIQMEKNGRTLDVTEKVTSNQVRCLIHRSSEANVTVLRKGIIHIVCIMHNYKLYTVWPMNCRTFPFHYRGEPNTVWLRAADILLFIPFLSMIYTVAMMLGSAGAYIAVTISPKLLRGHDRVVITKNPARGNMLKPDYTVFVMPYDWINPRKNMF